MSLKEEMEKDTEKHAKIAYSRDFLLSLSELSICKELPSGFDESLLSEFEDGYHGTQDRLRNPGSLPLQSHRRNDCSSSPPRGDSNNYSRGVYGRWDNRPSVRSDRDNESQFDKDSDSGRPFGNQSRRPWQSSEHDGLLGSGSFARPPGYGAGLSAPKGRSNDQYQLKKSNEPYQPPRPYKAGPISRREITDSINDETFGSSECASQDQAEEERRRRESFELMRKEQHKSLQEQQKLTTANKLKKEDVSNTTEMFRESEIRNTAFSKIAEQESMIKSGATTDSYKTSQQMSVVRPLVPPGFVPPGFKKTAVEKNSSTTSLAHSCALGAERPEAEESIAQARAIKQSDSLDNQEEKLLVQKICLGERQHADLSRLAQPSPILDKLFSNDSTDNLSRSSSFMEDSKGDDKCAPRNVNKSSKFAQWFVKDEAKGADHLINTRPNDFLSLIISGEKGGSQASDVKSTQHTPHDLPFPGSEITDRNSASNIVPSTIRVPKTFCKSSKEETASRILTCEDLEQTILLGYSGSSSTFHEARQGHNVSEPMEPKAETDSRASHHLLSLLQKGPVLKDKMVPSIREIGSTVAEVENVSGQPSTLETLFGSAFMKELKSAEAPVSSQRGSTSSAVTSSTKGPISIDGGQREQSKSENFGSWLGISNTQVNSSNLQTDVMPERGGFDAPIDIQFPIEESLIAGAEPVNTRNTIFNPFGSLIDADSQLESSNRLLDISDQLAAFRTGLKDVRPLMHGPHGSLDRDIPFQNHHVQAHSSQLPQMNHGRPFFHPLDSHPTQASPPLNFNAPEGMIQRGGPINHQFPPNMMRPPSCQLSGGHSGFDPSRPMLQQMMQMQRPTPNNIPQHILEFNRNAQLPSHLRTRSAGPMPEHNPMQGFPFQQHQANFGGPGMPVQAPHFRGNHPEALQQLLEMELRANSSSKRMHPFAPLGNNSQGLHGHDLDMSFNYR